MRGVEEIAADVRAPLCKGLIDEIPGYSWDEDKALKGKDEPIQADDDSCDAGRYVAHTTEPLWRNLLALAA